jgi:hypothetical protein
MAQKINGFDTRDFTPTNTRLAWGSTLDARRWSQLFSPSDDVKAWDDAPAGTTHTIYSHLGQCHAFVTITITGRRPLHRIPANGGWSPEAALSCRVTFAAGTDDETTETAWIVENPINAPHEYLADKPI